MVFFFFFQELTNRIQKNTKYNSGCNGRKIQELQVIRYIQMFSANRNKMRVNVSGTALM